MSVCDDTQQMAAPAHLLKMLRYDGRILYVLDKHGAARAVYVSARFAAAEVRRLMTERACALVMPVAPGLHPADDAIYGVATDFVATEATKPAERVLHVDEIVLGNGAARIFFDHDALHITAENIDTSARYLHRITGGSIKIG